MHFGQAEGQCQARPCDEIHAAVREQIAKIANSPGQETTFQSAPPAPRPLATTQTTRRTLMKKAVLSRHAQLTRLFGPAGSPERTMKIGGTAFTLCGTLCVGIAIDVLVEGVGPATSLFCGSIGLLFLGAGSGFLLIPLLRKRKRQWIRVTGTPVKAKAIEIRHVTSFGLQTTWNDWSPWVIVAEAEEGLDKKATFTQSEVKSPCTASRENQRITPLSLNNFPKLPTSHEINQKERQCLPTSRSCRPAQATGLRHSIQARTPVVMLLLLMK
jgi:hypothetical protein